MKKTIISLFTIILFVGCSIQAVGTDPSDIGIEASAEVEETLRALQPVDIIEHEVNDETKEELEEEKEVSPKPTSSPKPTPARTAKAAPASQPTPAPKPEPVSEPAPAPTKESVPQQPIIISETPETTWELELLRLVNIERVNEGIHPLRYNTGLEFGAMIRANEIIEKFSHTRPDGTRFFAAFGPDFRYRHIGENLAKGFRNPAQVMRGWMSSPSHRANILNPSFEEFASAIITCEDGDLHWVQIFFSAHQ